MDKQIFLKAVEIYKSKGGNTTCSPNKSCEGETPDVVILKDFDGFPVAKILLSVRAATHLSGLNLGAMALGGLSQAVAKQVRDMKKGR